MDSLIATSQDLPYIKLHGCINKIGEYDPPLILTVDQYVSHRSKREVLFERLKSLGASNTLLFIGHSLEDSDIRQILHEVNSITSSRPRYYALVLDYTSMQSRLWEGKKVSLMKGTFESFLNKLDEEVSEVERTYEPTHNSHPIERFFVSNDYELTKDSIDCLKSHLQFRTLRHSSRARKTRFILPRIFSRLVSNSGELGYNSYNFRRGSFSSHTM